MKASRSKRVVKRLIEISLSIEEADKVISENYDFASIREKLDFLKELYRINTCESEENQSDEDTYWKLLKKIVEV